MEDFDLIELDEVLDGLNIPDNQDNFGGYDCSQSEFNDYAL